MTNVRVWFEKKDECRFISHLDLNRVMLRAVQKSKIPVWHTEGFNTHAYITFAAPLSLGFTGLRESMDFRLLDDNYPLDKIVSLLNDSLPLGIRVFDSAVQKMKASQVALACYEICYTSDDISADKLYNNLNELFELQEIIVDKKTKKGIKQIDIKPFLKDHKIAMKDDCVQLSITLPCSSAQNINPNLIKTALDKKFAVETYAFTIRTDVLNGEGKPFE